MKTMPRIARSRVHAEYFHVVNRGHTRQELFAEAADCQSFLGLLHAAPNANDVAFLAYTLMPNHWHLVVKPLREFALSAYVGWVTGTHASRWKRRHQRDGLGSVYQGRFRSYPIRSDQHLLTVLRYVEANPVRSGLVARAADWPWSSAAPKQDINASALAAWPIAKPANWEELLTGDCPR